MDKIRKAVTGEVKSTADPMILDIVGSTEEVDRDGDIIRLDGWELDSFRKNPVFMWAHNYSMPPLGKAIQITKDYDARRLVFRVKFSEHNPMAVMVAKMYQEKVLNASSVGFAPKQFKDLDKSLAPEALVLGRDYLRQELLELSAVPIPSNAGAVALALSKGVVTKEKLDDLHLVKSWDEWKGMLAEMVGKPLPKPGESESEDEFVSRCMSSDLMKEEYPEQDQRLAVCYSQFNRKGALSFLLKRMIELEKKLKAIEDGEPGDSSLEPGHQPKGSDDERDPVFDHILDMAQRARALNDEPLVKEFTALAKQFKKRE